MFERLMDYTLNRPKVVVGITVFFVVAALAQFPRIKVDTDPENMLPADAPVRVFHHQAKKEFGLYDFIVLGIVDEVHPEGVFTVSTLTKIYNITEEVKNIKGVIAREIIALSTKDNIEQGEVGSVRFNWLMEAPPKNEAEALALRREAQDHPMFKGSVVSPDGKAVAVRQGNALATAFHILQQVVAVLAGVVVRRSVDGKQAHRRGILQASLDLALVVVTHQRAGSERLVRSQACSKLQVFHRGRTAAGNQQQHLVLRVYMGNPGHLSYSLLGLCPQL